MPELKKEQSEVVFHDQGNILVSASAGSGKTFTMIERIKRLVLEGKAEVGEILAVTFTEMAAYEMKEKLSVALNKKLQEGPNELLSNALFDVPISDICTIHSFCAKLIRKYFYQVGIAPDFKILDESESAVLMAECIDEVFRREYVKKDSCFLSLIDRHSKNRTDSGLKELILTIYRFCSSEADPDSLMEKHRKYYREEGFNNLLKDYKNYLDERLKPIKEQAVSLAKAFEQNGLVKSSALMQKMASDIQTVIGGDVYGVVEFKDYSLRMDFDRKLNEEDLERKERAKELKERLVKIFDRFSKHVTKYKEDLQKNQVLMEHTDGLVRLVKEFTAIYSEHKRQENVVDFNDLEHFALDVLRNTQTRESVKSKYKYLFVDEYQDVNGAQEEIISLLSSNNLFMVGDVKQSIYGFRGCRPEIFADKTEKMLNEGQKVVRLNDNFRSANAVIDMVNQIFDYCMIKEYFGEDYKHTSRLKSGGVFPEGKDGRAKLHILIKDAKKRDNEIPRIYDLFEEINKTATSEESLTATLIADIINKELTEKFFDVKSGQERFVTYGDIVILSRNRNGAFVRDVGKGLIKRGIPVTSDARENVCDFPEISMVINALKLIDCFYQDVPLGATLKSPIGGFSDEDLLSIARFYYDALGEKAKAGGFCDAFSYYIESAKTPLSERLIEFKNYIDNVRLLADFIGAEGVVNKLIEDKDLESFLLGSTLGKVKVGRLRRLVSATISAGKKLSVKEFIKKVEASPDSLSFSEGGEDNSVKIMTAHSSKGLEFPVVIVCGLERLMNSEEEKDDVLMSRDYGLGVYYYDDEHRTKTQTPFRGIIKERMKDQRVNEEMRLFYVANTRARYSLHLTYVGRKDVRKDTFMGADRWMEYLPPSLDAQYYNQSDLSFLELGKEVRTVIIGKSDKAQEEQMKENFSFVYPFENDTVLPLKTSVTNANINLLEKPQFVKSIVEEEVSDVERGNLAHKILEHYDFDNRISLLNQVDKMIQQGVIGEDCLQKLNIERIDNAINSSVFDWVKGKKLYREKSFIVEVDGQEVTGLNTKEKVLLQGVIDLLAIGEDGAYIIDYKYSVHAKDALIFRYKKQLDLYAYAVEKVLKIKVKKKALVNLLTGECAEII